MNKNYTVLCTKSYEEDSEQYWTKGVAYKATKHDNNTWSIETDMETVGKVGPNYMLNNFNENFKIITEEDENNTDNPISALFDEIESRLSNRYKILEGDFETIYVKDRKTNTTLEVKIKEIVD